MSYYISMIDSSVILKKQDHKEIMKRWHKYCQPKFDFHEINIYGIKQEFTKPNLEKIALKDYDDSFNKPEDFLSVLGFGYHILPNKDILIKGYENKLTSSLPIFLELIIDLIKPGSEFEWKGQDETIFYWRFNGKKIEEIEYVKYKKMKEKEKEKEFEILAEELKDFFDKTEEKTNEVLPKEKTNRYQHML